MDYMMIDHSDALERVTGSEWRARARHFDQNVLFYYLILKQ